MLTRRGVFDKARARALYAPLFTAGNVDSLWGVRPSIGMRPMGLPVQQQDERANAPMTKRAESKYKINRRLGINLWGRPKSPVNKRNTGRASMAERRKKPTDFGTQLMAKQS